jgi:hypothetical protein
LIDSPISLKFDDQGQFDLSGGKTFFLSLPPHTVVPLVMMTAKRIEDWTITQMNILDGTPLGVSLRLGAPHLPVHVRHWKYISVTPTINYIVMTIDGGARGNGDDENLKFEKNVQVWIVRPPTYDLGMDGKVIMTSIHWSVLARYWIPRSLLDSVDPFIEVPFIPLSSSFSSVATHLRLHYTWFYNRQVVTFQLDADLVSPFPSTSTSPYRLPSLVDAPVHHSIPSSAPLSWFHYYLPSLYTNGVYDYESRSWPISRNHSRVAFDSVGSLTWTWYRDGDKRLEIRCIDPTVEQPIGKGKQKRNKQKDMEWQRPGPIPCILQASSYDVHVCQSMLPLLWQAPSSATLLPKEIDRLIMSYLAEM